MKHIYQTRFRPHVKLRFIYFWDTGVTLSLWWVQVHTEEVFGPTMELASYKDYKTAIANVNQSKFGLQVRFLAHIKSQLNNWKACTDVLCQAYTSVAVKMVAAGLGYDEWSVIENAMSLEIGLLNLWRFYHVFCYNIIKVSHSHLLSAGRSFCGWLK